MVKLLNMYFGSLCQKSDFEKMSTTSYHGGDPISGGRGLTSDFQMGHEDTTWFLKIQDSFIVIVSDR